MVATFNLNRTKHSLKAPPDATNYVNVSKLACMLRQKIMNSELADSSVRFLFMFALFILITMLQRNAVNSEEATAALRSLIRETQYRDPFNFEMKNLMALRSTDEFWNWLQVERKQSPKHCFTSLTVAEKNL
jgi:hypothetical protein